MVATQIFVYFHPELIGDMIQFDVGIFFRWVGEKPSTSFLIIHGTGIFTFYLLYHKNQPSSVHVGRYIISHGGLSTNQEKNSCTPEGTHMS